MQGFRCSIDRQDGSSRLLLRGSCDEGDASFLTSGLHRRRGSLLAAMEGSKKNPNPWLSE